MKFCHFRDDFAARKHARGCTSAGLHSRRVADNIPYLLGSGYADLGQMRPTSIEFSGTMRVFARGILSLFLVAQVHSTEIVSSDICIYGGTAGGVAAAIQAQRMNKSAVLVEPGNHLGGMTSGGLGATDIG